MSKYTIKKIVLKNFKLFGNEPYTINFDSDSLIVFDGPNGYGKTSVFDAIELALTGSIDRLYNVEYRQVPKDIVVAYMGKTDVEITIELSNSESNILLSRRLKKPLPSQSGKIKNFDGLWDLYLITDDGEEKIDENYIFELFGNSQIARDYRLFHYVQQEETAVFLKSNKEHQRAQALAELFGDTKSAEQKRMKLEKIIGKISSIINQTRKKQKNLEELYGFKPGTIPKAKSSLLDHSYLLPWMSESASTPEWDAPEIKSLTSNKRGIFFKDINRIKELVFRKETYLTSRVYKISAKQKDILKPFILYYLSLDKYKTIKKKYSISKTINEAVPFISTDQLDEMENKCDLALLFKLVDYQDGTVFVSELRRLIQAKKQNKGSSALFTELQKYRIEMRKKISELDDEKFCPLCGNDFGSESALLEAIERKGKDYEDLLSDDDKKIVKLSNSFQKKYIMPLRDLLIKFERNLSAPKEEFIKGLDNAQDIKSRLDKLHDWLEEEHIKFADLLVESSVPFPTDIESEQKYEMLSERIISKSPILTADYIEASQHNGFDEVFSSYFNLKARNLKLTTPEQIDGKIAYINNYYFNSLTKEYKRYDELNKTIEKLQAKKEEIRIIKDIFHKEIRLYQKSMITDIEIPFYIYSGKILQNHHAGAGSGIFIKDPAGGNELKNVRLVSDLKTDHDVLNTMSSGQISAIVIAFSLALNKVYAGKLNTILIDDPVQTMDDINMISFIELLRNDFKDKQLILSTHEEDVSKFILYKFLKHGHTVRNINLMERKEYQMVSSISQAM